VSGINKHYDTTIERIRDYYGIVTDSNDLQKMIKKLEQINSDEIEYNINPDESINEFLKNLN
jgi:ureidoacrylate peracid hydrolase